MNSKSLAITAAVAFVVGVGVGQLIPKSQPATQAVAPSAEMNQGHGEADGGMPIGAANPALEYAKERPALEARLQANSEDAEALVKLGICDLMVGDTVTGLDRLSHGAVITNDPRILVLAGIGFAQVAESEKAVAAFEKALIDDPKNADALYRAGLVCFHNLGDTKKAAAYWKRYLEAAPQAENADLIRRAVTELEKNG